MKRVSDIEEVVVEPGILDAAAAVRDMEIFVAKADRFLVF